MKTVSTLCATSTVGVAAIGLVGAVQTSTLPSLDGDFSYTDTNYIPTVTSPTADLYSIPLPRESFSERRLSESKSWYKRLSTPFASKPTSPQAPHSPPQSAESNQQFFSRRRSRSQSVILTPSTLPPTRNKLVKKSLSRTLGPSPLSQSSRPPTRRDLSQRPSTASNKQPTPHVVPLQDLRSQASSRPTTAVSISEKRRSIRTSVRQTVGSWTFFLTPKRQKPTSASSEPSIKRIYPDPTVVPTFVHALMISHDQSDRMTVYSASPSLYMDTRPSTPLGPMQTVSDANSVSPKVDGLKRSYSISNVLTSASNRLPSKGSIARRRFSSVVDSEAASTWKRPSTGRSTISPPFSPLSPTSKPLEPVTPSPPPPLPDLSALNLRESSFDVDSVAFPLSRPARRNSLASTEPRTPLPPAQQTPKASDNSNRLSLVSAAGASERSTLIGSEKGDAESDLDFMSETVFDSMRTRSSETPVRADSIFNASQVDITPATIKLTDATKRELDRQSEGNRRSVLDTSESGLLRVSTIWSKGSQGSKGDGDDESWDGSNWDLHSAGRSDNGESDFSKQRKKLEFAGKSDGSFQLHSNNSKSSFVSFGSAIDDSEEEDDISSRPKTSHLAFSSLNNKPQGLHVRSHSMPLGNSLGRAYARAIVSENWDDDFAESCGEDVVIPQAIEDKQASVVDHLSYVREFATLVEELKSLRDRAFSSGVRYSRSRHLWEEADGIIALANLQSDDGDVSSVTSSHYSLAPEEPIVDSPSSMLSDDDNCFGTSSKDNDATPTKSRTLEPPLKIKSTPSKSPTRMPVKRAVTPTYDPMDVARSILERMRVKHGHTGSFQSFGADGKIQFDTFMLSELVEQVNTLMTQLNEALNNETPRRAPPVKEQYDIEGRKLPAVHF